MSGNGLRNAVTRKVAGESGNVVLGIGRKCFIEFNLDEIGGGAARGGELGIYTGVDILIEGNFNAVKINAGTRISEADNDLRNRINFTFIERTDEFD